MEPLFVSISEAGKIVSLGRSTLYKLIAEGDLEVVKIGRRTLVVVESLRKLTERRS